MTRKTSLYEEHERLGAKMFEFAGWQMPLQYTSVKEEHLNVRENAGLFDVSHMGQVFVSGKDAFNYLQNLLPKDLSGMEEGKAVYSMLVNETGGIIDDLIIYKLSIDKYLIIVNASRISEDFDWLFKNKKDYDVNLDNQSDNYSMIALQGPKSSEIMEKLGVKKEDQPTRFHVKEKILPNIEFIARTGYTGEDGFELLVKNEEAAKLWQALLDKGQDFGLKPIGYAARDTLRLEASLRLYGQDMDETTSPIEASLAWTVSKDKKEDYPGKTTILDQMKNKNCKRKLVRFKMLDKAIARHDYEIYMDGQKTGKVTSGGFSPCLNVSIGFGYIGTEKDFTEGSKIDIMIREKQHPAEITKNFLS